MEKTRIVGQVDASGAVHEGAVLAVFYPKRRNGFDRHFSMNQDALTYLATKIESISDYRVLFMLMSILDFENEIQVSQATIAQELGMLPPNVNRSIKRLVKLGCLLEGPKIGRSVTYRLNPSFGWKGSAANHQKALKDRMDEKGFSVVE